MRIAILGFGEQGKSAYRYWDKPGNEITICDSNEAVEAPDNSKLQLGSDYLSNLDQFDIIVRSPSIHPKDIVSNNNESVLSKVTTVTNEFLRVCPTKNVIGVTGTKGKGTTSTLIAKILEASGKRVILGGNIGIAPLELLNSNIEEQDWVVLELANFQLIDIKSSPKIAVCLMVVAEHLDWHENIEEYIEAKSQLFKYQTTDDIAIYYDDNEESKKIASVSPGIKIPYYKNPGAQIIDNRLSINNQSICGVEEFKLLGKHNWQNICAAVTCTWQIDQNMEAIKSVLTTFSGLEHRLQLIRTLNQVSFYDDSFATTPESAIVAIEAFKEPKVLILGGSDKKATYDQLAETVKNNNVRKVVVIGETGPAIAKALQDVGFSEIVQGGNDIASIVNSAKHAAQPGDVVLLSTGCASFGLFKNYKDRGEQFTKAVQVLV